MILYKKSKLKSARVRLTRAGGNVPPALLALGVVCIFAAGSFLGKSFSGFKNTEFLRKGYSPKKVTDMLGSGKKEDPLWVEYWRKQGAKSYQAWGCTGCHGVDGSGLSCPALNKSPYVTHSNEALTMIVLKGLKGEIEVLGKKFNLDNMIGYEQNSDEAIAQLISYLRGTWDNNAEPVSAEFVAQVRAKYTSQSDKFDVKDVQALVDGNSDLDAKLPENWQLLKLSEFEAGAN